MQKEMASYLLMLEEVIYSSIYHLSMGDGNLPTYVGWGDPSIYLPSIYGGMATYLGGDGYLPTYEEGEGYLSTYVGGGNLSIYL